MNMLYDLIKESGADWKTVREAMVNDPRIGESHTEPLHKSGRGAGGHCFIKDFEAFRAMYGEKVSDRYGDALLAAFKDKNIALLASSGKDLDLLEGVYGDVSGYKG